MSGLTRLYPKTWRDRYGREFDALLEDTPLTLPVLADVLMGATRARVTASVAALRPARSSAAVPMTTVSTDLRVSALWAASAGTLWALTFLVGTLVAWGKEGRDWGFVLLIAAAVGLFLAQLRMTIDWQPMRGLPLAWFALCTSALGMAVLGLAIAAAAAPPSWSLGLGWPPPKIWLAGMVVVVVGSGLFAMAWMRSGRLGIGALLGMVALALLLVSLLPPPTLVVDLIRDATGMVIASGAVVPTRDWFTNDSRVAVPAVLFGVTWMLLGLDQMRKIANRPALSI